jgi:hypothetical protein
MKILDHFCVYLSLSRAYYMSRYLFRNRIALTLLGEDLYKGQAFYCVSCLSSYVSFSCYCIRKIPRIVVLP